MAILKYCLLLFAEDNYLITGARNVKFHAERYRKQTHTHFMKYSFEIEDYKQRRRCETLKL